MVKKNSRTMNSILNVMTSIGGQLFITLLKFATRTVFIHTLGKSYLGISGLFSDILTMLSLTELGIDTGMNFQLYKPLAEGDDHRVRVLMKFYRQAYRVVGTVIMIIGLCLIPALPHLIKDYDSLEGLGINAGLVFTLYLLQSATSYLFWAYRGAVIKANQQKYIIDIADFVVTVIRSICQIVILLVFNNFIAYVAIAVLFNVLRNFVTSTIAKRIYPQFFLKEPDSLSKEEIFGLFKDFGALFLYKANITVMKATDNLVLSKFVGLVSVGLYSNYLLFYWTIKSFLAKIYEAVHASMGNLFVTSDMEKKYRFFQFMNYLSMLIYGTAAVGMAVCADEVIRVWISDSYVIKQPLAILVGVEILFQGLQKNLGQVRNISGAFRQMWYRPILGIIVNVVVSVALVQVWGIYGVIVGTIASFVFTIFTVDPTVIHRYTFKNYRPVSEYYKKNLLYIFQLFVMGAVDMWLCAHILPGHGWFSAILHVLIVALTVPASFVAIYWKSHECRYLMALIERILRRIMKKAARITR